MSKAQARSGPVVHGASRMRGVEVDSYNLELRDAAGELVGDHAKKSVFTELLGRWREPLVKLGADPLGKGSDATSRKHLEALLSQGDPEAAGVVQGAIEDFAGRLAEVITLFCAIEDWRDTEEIVIGGGLRRGRLGELIVGRASVLLKHQGHAIDLTPVRQDPDEAGLLGGVHLAPPSLLNAFDAVLTVDIGGSSIRAGVVEAKLDKADDLSKAELWDWEQWEHKEERPTRGETVARLAEMLNDLTQKASKKLSLAPFIGVGCPGLINEDGTIERGAQNLPGDWDGNGFNLVHALQSAIPSIEKEETVVVLHNDAVVQGLSQAPYMTHVEHWAALTIGTGLGNARFTNRRRFT